MSLKRYSIVFVVILLLSSFFSGFALADGEVTEEKVNLVSLGDSITYGYNLQNPQSEAFPYLIGDGSLEVTNLGVPGWTSGQLSNAVTTDASFTGALADADIVTLNIGSNDLLQAVGIQEALASGTFEVTPELQQKVQAAAIQMGQNLQGIIQAIRTQTTAPIVLYNLYNPFGSNVENEFLNYLHVYGEQVIQQVNTAIISPFQAVQGVFLVDAYTAFNGNQASYMIPGDVHPNVAGHQSLASLVNDILIDLLPEEDPGTEDPDTDEPGEEPGDEEPGDIPAEEDPEGQKPDEDKQVLVALGDSITFGYNLEEGNTSPSSSAFPNLISDGIYDVINHGYPGWTSTDLLNALKENPEFGTALQSADVVTLNIGSNDLLRVVRPPATVAKALNAESENGAIPPELEEQMLEAVQNLAENLQLILADIREQTSAPIVLYTLYNPFGESEDPFEAFLHNLGEQVIPEVNNTVINPIGAHYETLLADAYPAFTGKQADLILPGDVHPNSEGHQVLAGLADAALGYEAPVEEEPPVVEEPPVEEEPPVDEDPSGEEPPVDEDPTDQEDPAGEEPGDEEDEDQTPVAPKTNTENKLPLTATSMFNFLAIGTLLTALGTGIWVIQDRRNRRMLDL